jgi:hypothetical protein
MSMLLLALPEEPHGSPARTLVLIAEQRTLERFEPIFHWERKGR